MRRYLSVAVALALLAIAAAPLTFPDAALAADKAASAGTAKRSSMRQFTGYVTSVDKTTLTVEKRGKKPQSRVFTKHADLRTIGGDVEKDARVTVYFREDGGRTVAHRVVVKDSEDEDSTKDR